MAIYKVKYDFRKDEGLGVSTPTETDVAIVEAADEGCARLQAIDAAYRKHFPCSHVQNLQSTCICD